MSGPWDHDPIVDLLGPFALDALEPDEAALVKHHIGVCGRCRSELDDYRRLAAALATTTEEPPASLWDRISQNLPSRPAAESTSLVRGISERFGGTEASAGVEHEVRTTISKRKRWGAVGRVARPIGVAAAAIAIALLSLRLVQTTDQLDQNRQALQAQATTAAVQAALATPGHRTAVFTSARGEHLADAVYLPDGRGYLIRSSFAGLPSNETYQLWAILDGQPISLGLLGPHPLTSAFTVAGTERPSSLVVTIEPARGVPTPDRAPVATATFAV